MALITLNLTVYNYHDFVFQLMKFSFLQLKCERYWPESLREPVYHGDLCIEMENKSHLPEYVLRTISITLVNKILDFKLLFQYFVFM